MKKSSFSGMTKKGLATLLAGLLLTACTFLYPPSPNLPSRAGIAPGETITVQGNQNVYGVARRYNVSMRELIVLNDIKAPFTLRSGQQLILPAGKTGEESDISASASSAPTPVSAPSGAIEQTTLPPVQTAAISQSPLNPPVNNTVTGAPVTASPVTALNAPSTPPRPVATTVEPSNSEQVASITPPPAPEGKANETPAPSVNFKWPVQGPVLSGFGPKGQGLSNDGVNIAAPKGAPVVAAASGIVVYAGNEMKGFGNLVLIRHQGGWVTAYAHLDRALVNKDAVVAQGDMIGTVGKTGNVPSPQLHFETRYNGKSVDPAGVIKAQ